MRLPAICESCNRFFPSSIEASSTQEGVINDIKVGPCPYCGGIGHIPNGVYKIINETIELLSGPESSILELKRLAEILRNAKNNKSTHEEIQNKIKEDVPQFSSVKDILSNKSDLYEIINILLTIISIVISLMQIGGKIEVNNVINDIYINNNIKNEQIVDLERAKPAKPHISQKIGRNEPCYCGSGKKYKHCHGK